MLAFQFFKKTQCATLVSNNLKIFTSGLQSEDIKIKRDFKTDSQRMSCNSKSSDVLKSKKENIFEKKEKYLCMSLEEKRTEYRCGKGFITLSSLPTWPDVLKKELKKLPKKRDSEGVLDGKEDEEMNKKVTLWMGDITSLEVDVIVNAANASLMGGGGVDGAIHKAAGGDLVKECGLLRGCAVGEAVITGGFKLPAKYVIHTVGPRDSCESKLRKCYENCFKRFDEKSLTSIAFCCIATGIYGYPNFDAANIAVSSAKNYLQQLKVNDKERYRSIERVIFCIFLHKDLPHYLQHLLHHFPTPLPPTTNNNCTKKHSCVENNDEEECDRESRSGDEEEEDGNEKGIHIEKKLSPLKGNSNKPSGVQPVNKPVSS